MQSTICQPNKTIKPITTFLLVIAAIATIPFMIYVGRPNNIMLDVFTVLFMIMQMAPYVIMIVINYFLNKSSCASMLIFIISLLLIIGAVAAFYYGFYINAKGQNGLFLIAVPVLQIVVSVVLGGLLFLRCRRKA